MGWKGRQPRCSDIGEKGFGMSLGSVLMLSKARAHPLLSEKDLDGAA